MNIPAEKKVITFLVNHKELSQESNGDQGIDACHQLNLRTIGCSLDVNWSKTFQGLMSLLSTTPRGLRNTNSDAILGILDVCLQAA
jgi:hypothetical protein